MGPPNNIFPQCFPALSRKHGVTPPWFLANALFHDPFKSLKLHGSYLDCFLTHNRLREGGVVSHLTSDHSRNSSVGRPFCFHIKPSRQAHFSPSFGVAHIHIQTDTRKFELVCKGPGCTKAASTGADIKQERWKWNRSLPLNGALYVRLQREANCNRFAMLNSQRSHLQDYDYVFHLPSPNASVILSDPSASLDRAW